jgi:hypothetical protein
VDFAVIDGVWAMEGQGPLKGTPVATDVVLAGLNRVAVDRVALNVMEISQDAVVYLTYAAQAGLGPRDTNNVSLLGDAYVPYPFVPAKTAPILWQPAASPSTISISAGESTTITYRLGSTCYTLAEVIQDSDATPGVSSVRTLHSFEQVHTPGESVVWNGRDDAGSAVSPGLYLARVRARTTPTSQPINCAVGRITVKA